MALKSFARQAALALHPLIAFAGVAMASDMLALKPEANVTGDVVRLGDLVTGAGEKGNMPLFRAPDLGKIGTIRAESIRKAAAELGLESIDLRGMSAVTVIRSEPVADAAALGAFIREQLLRMDGSLGDATVEFDAPLVPVKLGKPLADAVQIPVFELESGRFRAEVTDHAGRVVTIRGIAQSRVVVPVLLRSVGRGDVITPADFVMEARGRRTLPSGLVTDPARLASVIAKRPLKPGPIRAEDVTGRDLVERNQKVAVTYSQSGLSLTMSGKALASGAQGAVVQVQNLASKRSFDAIVTGPGAVTAKIY